MSPARKPSSVRVPLQPPDDIHRALIVDRNRRHRVLPTRTSKRFALLTSSGIGAAIFVFIGVAEIATGR
jgi:hypothetical protein